MNHETALQIAERNLKKEENKLNIDDLVNEALQNIEILETSNL